MTRILVAAIGALFLGGVVTELQARLFPGRSFALLVLTTLAVFVGSIFTARVGARLDPRTMDTSRPSTSAPDASGDLETGRVKWFNRTKGFGFIVREDGSEIFVHHRNVLGSGRRGLKDGEIVRFKVAAHDKGLQAEQVSAARES